MFMGPAQDSGGMFSYSQRRMMLGIGAVLGGLSGWFVGDIAMGAIAGMVAALFPICAIELWKQHA